MIFHIVFCKLTKKFSGLTQKYFAGFIRILMYLINPPMRSFEEFTQMLFSKHFAKLKYKTFLLASRELITNLLWTLQYIMTFI